MKQNRLPEGRMSTARRQLAARLALIAATSAATATPADACCLTDYLFGRSAVPVATMPVPVTTSQPFVTQGQPFVAGRAPIYTGPVVGSSVLPLAQNNSVFAPPLDNPSVYTGQPVISNYRGVATTSNPFYGTGNVYPDAYAAARPAVAAGSVQTLRVPVVPVTPGPRGGLARFFSSIFGTDYQSRYVPAETTYYRPQIAYSPVNSAPTVIQQGCTSSTDLLQRSAVTSFQPAVLPATPNTYPTYPPAAGGDCGIGQVQYTEPCDSAATYGSAPGHGAAPAFGAAPDYPPAQNYAPAPSPRSGQSFGGGDLAPIPAPQLNANRPQLAPLTGPPARTSYNDYARSVPVPAPTNPPEDFQTARPALPPITRQVAPLEPPTTTYRYQDTGELLERSPFEGTADRLHRPVRQPRTAAAPSRINDPQEDRQYVTSEPPATNDAIRPIPMHSDYQSPLPPADDNPWQNRDVRQVNAEEPTTEPVRRQPIGRLPLLPAPGPAASPSSWNPPAHRTWIREVSNREPAAPPASRMPPRQTPTPAGETGWYASR